MRETLFRGKRKDTGKWVYGDLFYKDGLVGKEDDHFYILNADMMGISEREVIPETVGEYTGLADKNGVKIFEGDIVRFFGPKRKGVKRGFSVGKIFCHDKYFTFYIEESNGSHWILANSGSVEVMGNIHDDPELAEGI